MKRDADAAEADPGTCGSEGMQANWKTLSFRVVGSLGVLPTTSVISSGISPVMWWVERLWEALTVVSQKWSFPTALLSFSRRMVLTVKQRLGECHVTFQNPRLCMFCKGGLSGEQSVWKFRPVFRRSPSMEWEATADLAM